MIIRVEHNRNNPYFQLRRACVDDTRLSYKAIGILVYLLSKPDNWKVRIEDLMNRHSDGECSIRSGLTELRECGYLTKTILRDETTGRVLGTEIVVRETSETHILEGSPPSWGFPPTGEHPVSGNRGLESNELVVNKETLATRPAGPSFHSNGTNGRKEQPPYQGFQLSDEDKPSSAEKTYPRQSAEKLFNVLLSKGKLTTRNTNLTNWSESIRTFLMNSEVEKDRFDRVLAWYCQHVGEKFVPQTYSANGFIDKFVQIETQMEHAREEGEEEPVRVRVIDRTGENDSHFAEE